MLLQGPKLVSKDFLTVAVCINLGVINSLLLVKGHFVFGVKDQNRHHHIRVEIFDYNIERFAISLSIENQDTVVLVVRDLKVVKGLVRLLLDKVFEFFAEGFDSRV